MASLYEAMLAAGIERPSVKPVKIKACNKLLSEDERQARKELLRPKLHKMGDMQEKYQGTRCACSDVFDLTGKRGKIQRVKIAHVYVETKPGRLELFKPDQHIYVPVQGKHWFLSKGVRLEEYKQGEEVYYILPTR